MKKSTARTATISRETRETKIMCQLAIDTDPYVRVASGIGFLDHMITSLALHAGWNLTLSCEGDVRVDDHHTAEDCALVLGAALREALGDRSDIQRFGWALAPLDEALSRVAVDLVHRPVACIDLGLKRDRLGDLSCENIPHFFRSLAMAGLFTLHVDVLKGDNDHHRAESAFKAFALALRAAATRADGRAIPSTKGVV